MAEKEYQTFTGWKRAVKNIDPSAAFYGNKDIGGAHGIGEWDGAVGIIFSPENRSKLYRGKNPVKPLKRRVGTSQGAKSRTTGKTPAKRLRSRRAKNTKPGYYPNPSGRSAVSRKPKLYVIFIRQEGKRFYYQGFDVETSHVKFGTEKSRALIYHNLDRAMIQVRRDLVFAYGKAIANKYELLSAPY